MSGPLSAQDVVLLLLALALAGYLLTALLDPDRF